MIVKQLPQDALIDTLVGISDADLKALGHAVCADCDQLHEKTAMWYVPWGTRAICRACRETRVTKDAAQRASKGERP